MEIDADKLITEIERLNSLVPYGSKDRHDDGLHDAYKAVKNIIDSLQQEQPEVDYEKDLTEWMKVGPHTCYPWCTIPDAIKITAEHFYERGLNARKEE